MARKQRRSVPSVPLADALTWCGDAALRAVSSPQSRTNWKTRGVPWDVVGPILRAQMDRASAHVMHDPTRILIIPEDAVGKKRYTDAWQQVSAIWKRQTSQNENERAQWDALCTVLDAMYPLPKLAAVKPARTAPRGGSSHRTKDVTVP